MLLLAIYVTSRSLKAFANTITLLNLNMPEEATRRNRFVANIFCHFQQSQCNETTLVYNHNKPTNATNAQTAHALRLFET